MDIQDMRPEAFRSSFEQVRRRMEIDLGAGNMGVPEKSGQHREVGSRLFTCLVKRCQRSRCKAVAKIMQARCADSDDRER